MGKCLSTQKKGSNSVDQYYNGRKKEDVQQVDCFERKNDDDRKM